MSDSRLVKKTMFSLVCWLIWKQDIGYLEESYGYISAKLCRVSFEIFLHVHCLDTVA